MGLPSDCQKNGLDPTPVNQMCSTLLGSDFGISYSFSSWYLVHVDGDFPWPACVASCSPCLSAGDYECLDNCTTAELFLLADYGCPQCEADDFDMSHVPLCSDQTGESFSYSFSAPVVSAPASLSHSYLEYDSYSLSHSYLELGSYSLFASYSFSYMGDQGPTCVDDCTDQDLYSVCVAGLASGTCLDDCSQAVMREACMGLPSDCQKNGLDPTPVNQMCSTLLGSDFGISYSFSAPVVSAPASYSHSYLEYD